MAALDPVLATLLDMERPVPTGDVEGVSLAAYAALAVRLGARARPREEVLAEAGLDEARWAAVEPTWLVRLAAAARRGDATILAAFEAATAEAQDALAEGPSPSLDAWAEVIAGIEAGDEPARVLEGAGLGSAAFARAQRHHGARCGAEPALAAELRARVEARLAARRAR